MTVKLSTKMPQKGLNRKDFVSKHPLFDMLDPGNWMLNRQIGVRIQNMGLLVAPY